MANAAFRWLFISLLALSFPAESLADQIVMANGDKISGRIVSIFEGIVRIETEYAGAIEVDFSKVTDLKTDEPRSISLSGGETIIGAVESISDGRLIIASPVFGEMSAPRGLLKSLDGAETAEALGADLERTRERLQSAETELDETKRKLEKKENEFEQLTSVSKVWSGSVSIGAQLQTGNADTVGLHTDATAVRKVPREELRLKFSSDYVETEGVTDANDVYGEAKLKVFQNERLYLFGVTTMEYDELEDLDLRAQVFGGPGYKFIERERTQLLGELGAGLTGEFYDVPSGEGLDTTNFEASLWLNAEWKQKLFDRVEFFQGITLFPSLGDFGEFRVRSDSSLSTPIGNHWAVKLSAVDEYNSQPVEDVKKNDLRMFSSLEYKF